MMDLKLALPADVMDGSRCSLCNNFLTVPPIMIISEDGRENKCGRCFLVETQMTVRNKALENILRHLSFPCTYGCQHKMPWEAVKDHENECWKRTLQCPIYYKDCDTILTVSKMENHFNEKHLENIKYGNVITYDLKDDHSIVLLAVAGEEMFFIYLFAHIEFFSISISSIQPPRKYTRCNIKINSGDNTACISYNNCQIGQFDERLHCYQCMMNECHLDYHPYAQIYNKRETNRILIAEINGKAVRELLESPITINITIQLLAEDDTKKTAYQNNLRKCFECSVCHGFMSKPIYVCNEGHSICNICKLWQDRCSNCEAEIVGTRNFALEDMTENVELPCHYKEKGCTYTGYVNSLCKHELTCGYKLELD